MCCLRAPSCTPMRTQPGLRLTLGCSSVPLAIWTMSSSSRSLATLLRAHGDGLIDGITIKIARVGGVSRARLLRDVAVDLGLQVTIEDTGGAQIDTAAIAHLSLGTPPSSRTHTVDFHNWVTVANGTGDLLCEGGTMSAPTGPGLGIDVHQQALGQPLFVTGA